MYTHGQVPKLLQPEKPRGCWCIQRLRTGSIAKQFVHCERQAREGKLTCGYHHKSEEAAQKLAMEKKNG